MVNWLGQWTEEKDYNTFPKNQWCDIDYVAEWIRNIKYEVKTDIFHLIELVVADYQEDENVRENGYYAVKDTREYPDNLMINIEDLSIFVEENGGLNEFDFYA